ncbi:hypothetical protein [Vibrio mexicanus]|uniref:hypothetical protein n=1 Tax=Vibrio mexicanus TaxID=1004326 RepID=UPI000B1E7138|nr:hypothetical protein [Vibrio mexicanus]
MRGILIVAVIIQIVLAIQTDGLTRALAELSAFLLLLGLVISVKRARKAKQAKFEIEEV